MPSDRTTRILARIQAQQDKELVGAIRDKGAQGRGFPTPLRPAGRQLAISMNADDRGQPYRRTGRRLLGT